MNQLLCRLCSVKENLIYMFDVEQQRTTEVLRNYIWLATGIEIKETDIVSKMVCHRCCEIAVKLHKYRTNAVANDKLLKEQCGQQYIPPITDQEELQRVTCKLYDKNINENIFPNRSHSNEALEILNVTVKSEPHDFNQPQTDGLRISLVEANVDFPTNTNNATSQASQTSSSVHQLENNLSTQQLHNNTHIELPHNVPPVPEKSSVSRTSHSSTVLQPLPVTSNSNLINKKCATVAQLRKPAPKVKYMHDSVRKVLKEEKNIILPTEVLKSDIQPVISLDPSEVTEWYEERFQAVKQKLPNIVIKKVNNSVNYKVTSNADNSVVSTESNIASPNNNLKSNTSDHNSDLINCDENRQYTNSTLNGQRVPHESTISRPTMQIPSSNVSNVFRRTINSKPIPRAKKKTASRKSNPNRRRKSSVDSDVSEVIPQKKKRIYSNKNAIPTINKVDLPRESPATKTEEKAIFTSSLELTPTEPLPDLVDCQNIMATGKTLEIFMCPVCSVPCDTRKQLVEHEKTHLTCKFCKTKIRNLQLMKEHLRDSCYIRLVKDNAVVKLTKVDTLSSIVKKYPEAFRESQASLNLYCDETVNFKEFGINIESAEPPLVYNSPSNNFEEAAVDQDLLNVENVANVTIADTNKTSDAVALVTVTNKQKETKTDVVCISDDSDDEVTCTTDPPVNSLPSSNTLQNQTVHSALKAQQKKVESLFLPFQKNLTEKEMIRSLFKKYSTSATKRENCSQTFVPTTNNIKYTNTNLIILENMFNELLEYKVPVQLESQPKINARFKEGRPTTPVQPTLECWVHKKPMAIKKPTVNQAASKNNTPSKITFDSLLKSSKSLANPAKKIQIPRIIARPNPPKSNLTRSPVVTTPTNSQTSHTIISSVASVNTPTSSFGVNTMPVTTTLNISKNLFVPATIQNSVSIPIASTSQISSYHGSNSVQPTNLMQVVATPNNSLLPVQYQAAATASTVNSVNMIQTQPSNLMRFVDSPSVTVNHYPTPVISQNGTLMTCNQNQLFQRQEPVCQINSNVTNVNKIILLANNVPQPCNSIYETSYLNTMNLQPPSYEQSLQIRELNSTNQPVMTTTAVAQPTLNHSTIRVKNICELRES